MTTHDDLVAQRDEAERLQAYYKNELERQRVMNTELRKAVADMARGADCTTQPLSHGMWLRGCW